MVQENLKTVRERIEAACRRVGRDPGEVTLIAVSKTKPVDSWISGRTRFRRLPESMK